MQADFADLTLGSDHEIYGQGSFRIPSIYLNDWPDRYIHTNFDVAANIDPTKLRRAGFIAAASGWYLANLATPSASATAALVDVIETRSLRRAADVIARRAALAVADAADADALSRFDQWSERTLFDSVARFAPLDAAARAGADRFLAARAKALRLEGDATYEVSNLIDGKRTAQEIRDALTAIYGPVALADVVEYLRALASAGVLGSGS